MKNAYPVLAVEHSLDTLDIKRCPTSLEIPRGGIYKKRSTANKLRIDRRERERERSWTAVKSRRSNRQGRVGKRSTRDRSARTNYPSVNGIETLAGAYRYVVVSAARVGNGLKTRTRPALHKVHVKGGTNEHETRGQYTRARSSTETRDSRTRFEEGTRSALAVRSRGSRRRTLESAPI